MMIDFLLFGVGMLAVFAIGLGIGAIFADKIKAAVAKK